MKFVRAIWKLLVGIKDALVLLLLIIFFGGLYGALSARPAPVREGVLDLNLNGSLVEQPARPEWADLAGSSRTRQYRLRDMVAALEKAKDDSRVKAVALDLDGFSGGGATAIGDLADAVRQVRAAGKPVVAYGVGYTDDSYELASAASEIWLNPLGGVLIAGPGGSNLYFKGLLDKAGLKTNQRGQLETDHEFRTGVPGIWAIGDVIPGPMLAHKAEDEGIAVAENIAGLTGIVNHDVIPSVVYTMPEIAGVGLTEEQAKELGEVKVGKFPMLANSRAKTNRETDGFVKVVADAKSDRVLGVWMIASVAGTMIAQAAQAMEFGATSEDIAYTCHAHPTHSEALKEAAMAVTGKPIHI
jgi:hypothetical protein